MIDDLKVVILTRVINELFQKADNLIKKGIKIKQQNKTMINVGMTISLMGLTHFVCPPTVAVVMDSLTLLLTSQIIFKINREMLSEEVAVVKGFFDYFNVEKDDICQILKDELIATERYGSFFDETDIKDIIDTGILNLKDEEIETFSTIRFNDQQEQYLRKIIAADEKINVINFLDLCMLEGSAQNKKFINLGGKNKSLKEILNPEKKLKLMK